MIKSVVHILALTTGASAIAAQGQPAPMRDYFNDKFEVERVMDWGERPVWSFDSKRIAFTVDDEHLGPAYEMDVATRMTKCLTCKWGASGYLARIYYLADGSYLILGPPSLESADTKIAAKPERAAMTYLYWMPADASTPPQALGAAAGGEIAIDYDYSPPGTTRIAWGEFPAWGDINAKSRLLVGEVMNDGKRAWLVNRKEVYGGAPTDDKKLVTFTEAYDFIDRGNSVLFFTHEKSGLTSAMVKVDIATGKMTPMPTDGQHNETHSFPDVRFGLEESNRASDPSSPYRGMTGHRAGGLASMLKGAGLANADALGQQYGGKPFDLYVHDWNTGKRRRLTQMFEIGGEAHQSSPARDGTHIAYVNRPAVNRTFTGQSGIFIGTFTSKK